MAWAAPPKNTHPTQKQDHQEESAQPNTDARKGWPHSLSAQAVRAHWLADASTKPTPSRRVTPSSAKKPSARKRRRQRKALWGNGWSLAPHLGSWGGNFVLGVGGSLPLARTFALRFRWSLMFSWQEDRLINFSVFSLGMLIRLPSPVKYLRNYATVALDFWPLFNGLNTNPLVENFSKMPVFGVSFSVGVEFLFLPKMVYFLETGFSTGMAIGLATVERQEAFGFSIQSGLRFFF